MPTEQEIFDVVKGVLVELFDVKPETISLNTHLYTDLDLDSLDAIDLASALAKKAKIRLLEEEVRGIRTVGDIVALGMKKLVN
ncbi:MAG TPA: acyl carrier protein [Fibrobacteraceae bacterium]|nr:acyl carrier protein [Fibrobacteraceae bacterium]